MTCLREQGHQAESCRSLAKAYLECRMERCGSPACIRGCNEGSFCCGTVGIASVHLTVLLCRILRHSGQGCALRMQESHGTAGPERAWVSQQSRCHK